MPSTRVSPFGQGTATDPTTGTRRRPRRHTTHTRVARAPGSVAVLILRAAARAERTRTATRITAIAQRVSAGLAPTRGALFNASDACRARDCHGPNDRNRAQTTTSHHPHPRRAHTPGSLAVLIPPRRRAQNGPGPPRTPLPSARKPAPRRDARCPARVSSRAPFIAARWSRPDSAAPARSASRRPCPRRSPALRHPPHR